MARSAEALKYECKPPSRPEKAILVVTKNFKSGDAQTFKRSLKKCFKKYKSIKHIEFNSPGGNLLEAIEIAEIIRSFHFATHLPEGNQCISACTSAFLGGFPRTIAPGASYIVHGASSSRLTAPLLATQVMEGLLLKFPSLLAVLDNAQKDIMGTKGTPKEVNQKVKIYQEFLGKSLKNVLEKRQPKNKAEETYGAEIKELAKFLAPKIVEYERGSASIASKVVQLLQRSRVSLKFIDYMYSTGIKGLKPLTPEELKQLAVTTNLD